jgi:uncharacterized protein YodC (DUF2158 family)
MSNILRVGDVVNIPEYHGATVIAVSEDGTRVRCKWHHSYEGPVRYWYDSSDVEKQTRSRRHLCP